MGEAAWLPPRSHACPTSPLPHLHKQMKINYTNRAHTLPGATFPTTRCEPETCSKGITGDGHSTSGPCSARFPGTVPENSPIICRWTSDSGGPIFKLYSDLSDDFCDF